jgi:hypothetical protein
VHGYGPNYEALWIPDDVDPDEAIILGLKWLLEQDGEPLVLLNAKIALRNNGRLEAAVHHYGIRHEAPVTIRNAHWSGGAILAPWARDDVLRCIDDWLAFKTTAVCVGGWMPDDLQEIDAGADHITPQGARYSDPAQGMIDR